ncbi:hypothetical protein GRF59_01405 [Paenibacillus sp. HJL G12]|uniref:Uncharacterized protein n=1 Tax=Paenibacillus dendrobii TaxID=2691084 RepID=A0A7X3LGK8_9BACL|nr:hypothetical protein [Paenibacillus dendrobii]MWV42274.1 hypothetical protein [Paenibacillus dendrobii]
MKTWIFAGLCDKSETLIYVCKMLASSDHSVLLVDATEKRKYPFYIGYLDEDLLLTEFAGFDVASGFEHAAALDEYLQKAGSSLEKYDYVIYDLELQDFCSSEQWRKASALVWITDYEIWTLEQGSRWLKDAVHRHFSGKQNPEMHKVIVRAVDEWFGRDYLDGYFSHLPITWKQEPIIIPWNELDMALKLRNEHIRKLHMKPLSRRYKKNLCQLVQSLTDWNQKQVNRALRNAERRRA